MFKTNFSGRIKIGRGELPPNASPWLRTWF